MLSGLLVMFLILAFATMMARMSWKEGTFTPGQLSSHDHQEGPYAIPLLWDGRLWGLVWIAFVLGSWVASARISDWELGSRDMMIICLALPLALAAQVSAFGKHPGPQALSFSSDIGWMHLAILTACFAAIILLLVNTPTGLHGVIAGASLGLGAYAACERGLLLSRLSDYLHFDWYREQDESWNIGAALVIGMLLSYIRAQVTGEMAAPFFVMGFFCLGFVLAWQLPWFYCQALRVQSLFLRSSPGGKETCK